MERWSGRCALVTGGSKGIGAAISSSLAESGMIVYACARDVTPITEAASSISNGRLIGIQCDLENEEEILKMFKIINAESGGVDVLVNNCGFALPTPLLSASTKYMRKMLDVNVLALTICTREAVKRMRERGVDDGHIIHINSSSGQRVSSDASLHFYGATKFALTALTEGLRQELRQIKSHIRISGVCPGITETPGLDLFATKEEKAAKIAKIGNIVLKPNDVADSVIYALSVPPHVQIHEVTVRPLFH